MKKFNAAAIWSWFWVLLGILYFLVPLFSTFDWSLRQIRGELTFKSYENAFADPEFIGALDVCVQSFDPASLGQGTVAPCSHEAETHPDFNTAAISIPLPGSTLNMSASFLAGNFVYSLGYAVLTIIAGFLLVVPTAFWVHLYLPRMRPVMEFLTLLPFVIPAIILVFGIIGLYSKPPLLLTVNKVTTTMLLIGGYVVLGLPYLYRSVDTGLRAMDVRALTEAAQSLGASWFTILWRVILPNLRTALLSGAMLSLTIVIGEVTFATFLGLPAFAPYLFLLQQHKAYEPAALAIVSFGLTWGAMGVIALVTSGVSGRQAQIAGGH